MELATVQTFAFGAVGYAGVTPKGETDFKFLASQPHSVAVAAFEKVYASGNPQGKSYALAGMKKLNQSRFKELLATTHSSSEQVEVIRGCIMSHETLSDVAT